jgi:long-chain acyl-CoA synthetase
LTVQATLAGLWSSAVAERRGGAPFLVYEDGRWGEVSWEEAGCAVDEIAAGFLALGIGGGDRVAMLARTRLEWTLCDWALISIGAPVVPVYPTSSALECAYILGNSGARFLVCEDAAQEAKVAAVRSEIEALEEVIVIEGGTADGLALADLRRQGRALLAADPGAVEDARSRLARTDVLTIVYTSGTTGPPKGCVLTHHNYRAMVDMVLGTGDVLRTRDVFLLHLPLAHTFARLVEFAAPAVGATIAFCPEVTVVPTALSEVRPTVFPSVPRVFEKIASAVQAGLEEQQGTRRRLARWALQVGARASARRQAGRRLPLPLAFQLALAERLVLARVRARLGGRLRHAISGGAPLPRETAQFFHSLGILVLEGYGLTECTTGATFNLPGRYRFGTVGCAFPGVEVALADDGEVLVRGENVFGGYFHDEEATREALTPDGWLRTGDVGELDDGFLTITDRKKDIIVTAGGKNVSPQNIEEALKASRYVSDALVVGDRRPYLVALLCLDHGEAGKVAATDHELRSLVQSIVDGVNADRSGFEQIRRFAILPREFSAEAAELTPTLKVRRHVAEQHFRREIEALYAGKP